jgi:IS5 family transposase
MGLPVKPGLRRHGSPTLRVTDEAIAKWKAPPRVSPGGQAHYSDMAIETALMLRLTFRLPLRQTEGVMESIFALLGMTVSAPDHSTLSRRATTLPSVSLGRMPDGPLHVLIDSTGLKVCGAGEWLQEKHGARARRSWRSLHLAVDAASGMIVAQTLTEKEIGDPSKVGPLLDQIQGDVEQVTADGAYDGAPTYQTVAQYGAHIRIVIPPHVTAVLSDEAGHAPSPRDRHIALIEAKGRLEWQKATGYGRRSLVETTIGRYKRIIGPQLRAKPPSASRF